jgi:hypothetical protein
MSESAQFAHPGNASIIAYLKRSSTYDPQTGSAVLRVNPELMNELDKIISETKIPVKETRRSSMYGMDVLATPSGLIFAWAGGTSDFFFRVRPDRIEAACADGARLDNTYPPEWLNFYVVRLGLNWREILKRWVVIVYEDALALG